MPTFFAILVEPRSIHADHNSAAQVRFGSHLTQHLSLQIQRSRRASVNDELSMGAHQQGLCRVSAFTWLPRLRRCNVQQKHELSAETGFPASVISNALLYHHSHHTNSYRCEAPWH